ncbi:CBASS cGAMP-activated phospholipase [Leeuwenhoekiella sp. A16]|uniref:CBASS cGAMP-activated phospholipase n=1 Tax=unclassified Leeuwenhoekiella TaxID=2615029 RepID=UPI003A80C47D
MNKKKFKILSIDGGGIKGVFPAMFLMLLEDELKNRSNGKTKIYQHFDLITGTSTGGIIAIALGLGISAKEIYNLYLDNAKEIFGNKKPFFFGQIRNSAHERNFLETLVRNKFKEVNGGNDPRLKDCKTDICIPIYDLIQGNPRVLKTKYHPAFEQDYHIPAYQAAMATSAAPTYFDPYTSDYIDLNGTKKDFSNKVDGGVMANNPTLVAFLEATKAFKVEMSQLEILSLGTGYKKFTDGNSRKKWGLYYWMRKDKRQRLIDLFMQSQSQLVANYISLLYQGIDKREKDNPNFVYDRIDVQLNEDNFINMDEGDTAKIKNFAELASIEFQHNRSSIIKKHFY